VIVNGQIAVKNSKQTGVKAAKRYTDRNDWKEKIPRHRRRRFLGMTSSAFG